MTAFFITGAGTEIGKTYVAAALLSAAHGAGFKTFPIKPLMSGFAANDLLASDAGVLLSACGRNVSREAVAEICLHQFEAPLAPNVAARRTGTLLNDDKIIEFAQNHLSKATEDNALCLVEGAGGVMSPATDTMLQLDLIKALELPAILVTANYLGGISHTLSAMAALDGANIPLAAVIVSQPDPQSPPPEEMVDELRRWREPLLLAAPYGGNSLKLGENLLSHLGLLKNGG